MCTLFLQAVHGNTKFGDKDYAKLGEEFLSTTTSNDSPTIVIGSDIYRIICRLLKAEKLGMPTFASITHQLAN